MFVSQLSQNRTLEDEVTGLFGRGECQERVQLIYGVNEVETKDPIKLISFFPFIFAEFRGFGPY